jgi:hypothetical protein
MGRIDDGFQLRGQAILQATFNFSKCTGMAFRWRRWTSTPLFVLALVPASLSCSSSASGPVASSGDGTYTPIEASAFNSFCSWSSAEAVAPPDAGDGLHNIGPLRVYWSQTPAHGSTAFPQGMLILKSSEEADPTKRTIFAMAKVGGGYNAAGGVPNWEWYSLQEDANCQVTGLWSGPLPLASETYSGQPIGDCDGCHSQAKGNDFVWDLALQLSNF